ncbi:MAG: hypothetical protein KF706_10260 [Chitinophagales bacterium]|nr:hypothetical protein [Chitinophagales bacterium]
MDALQQIIQSLNKEEVRYFKIYLSRISVKGERKDAQLFDLIRSDEKSFSNDKAAAKLHYAEMNAFYRLKNRLQEDICDAIALLHSSKVEANSLFREMMLFETFQAKGNLQLSVYFLKRAEKLATTTENLEVLDWIYSNYIKLSSDYPEIKPEIYIEKQKENALHLNRLRTIDQALATVIYRLKTAQTFGQKPTALLQMLNKSVKEFSRDNFLDSSKIFQTRLYRAVSQQLLQTHNYFQLEKYMLNTISVFETKQWFDKNNHDVKLQMRVYLTNVLFRNEKYEESLAEADKLGREILEYGKTNYSKYVFYYYNALYINYAKTDLNKAIKALDELDKVMKGMKNSYYEQFILLNKSTLFFELKKYNDAIRQLVRLYINDSYKNASPIFKLKISVAELIMQYESADLKAFKNKLEQVRKDFDLVLRKREGVRDKDFLKILELLSEDNLLVNKYYNRFIKKYKNSNEGNELLNYEKWLYLKFEDK